MKFRIWEVPRLSEELNLTVEHRYIVDYTETEKTYTTPGSVVALQPLTPLNELGLLESGCQSSLFNRHSRNRRCVLNSGIFSVLL